MKKLSSIMLLALGIVLLVGAYTGYVFWQKQATNQDLEFVSYSVAQYEEQVLKYQNKRLVEAIAAKETVDDFDVDTVEWSKIITKIRATIPEAKNGFDMVEVLSYSGGDSKEISISVKTVKGSKSPYLDVADFIKTFNDSDDFTENFVSSISEGVDTDGNSVLTFSFKTKYMESSIGR